MPTSSEDWLRGVAQLCSACSQTAQDVGAWVGLALPLCRGLPQADLTSAAAEEQIINPKERTAYWDIFPCSILSEFGPMAKFSFHKVPAEKLSLLKQNNHGPYGISLFYKQQNHFCQSSRMCCVQHKLVCTYRALCSTQAGLSVLLLKLVFSGAEQARFPSHHLHGIKSFLKWKLSTFFYKFVFFPFSRKGYLYCLFFSHI